MGLPISWGAGCYSLRSWSRPPIGFSVVPRPRGEKGRRPAAPPGTCPISCCVSLASSSSVWRGNLHNKQSPQEGRRCAAPPARVNSKLLMGAEKRLNSPSPGVVPHWGRGDKDGTPFMLPLIIITPVISSSAHLSSSAPQPLPARLKVTIHQFLFQGIMGQFRVRCHFELFQDPGAVGADCFDAER